MKEQVPGTDTTTVRIDKIAAQQCKMIGIYENTKQKDIIELAVSEFVAKWRKKNPSVKFPGDK